MIVIHQLTSNSSDYPLVLPSVLRPLSLPGETFHPYKFTTNKHFYLYKNKFCIYIISQKAKQTT